MEFLEREEYLDTLDAVLREAGTGKGRTALIGGEAGIGKTTLVEHFVARCDKSVRVLWGTCDALFTPRPLGPLYDIARRAPGNLGHLLETGSDWLTVASALLASLERSAVPTVVVVEDAHWADEATLDVVRFLGRRIERTKALLIVTYRDDELTVQHPLRRVLGDLPARATVRLALPPLSEQAVAQLAQHVGRSVSGLYATTGGNPFFVTEVLTHQNEYLPVSVRDSVLGRAAPLSPPARHVLDLASIVPGSIEQWLVATVLGPDERAIEECGDSGLLLLREDRLAFRHELARRAVEDSLPAPRARALHARVLAALLDRGEGPVPLALLVHHAALAGDSRSVLRFAPEAARQASAAGAHREAAAYSATALRHATGADPAERADLLQGRSFECYLTGDMDQAIEARQEATAIWRALNRPERAGAGLRWLSRLSWVSGNRQQADLYADEAIALLESLAPGRELAMAYSNRGQLLMLTEEDPTKGLQWSRRALALAEQLGETEIQVHALTDIGSAERELGDEAGRVKLERALGMALSHEMHEHVARAYQSLACPAIEQRDYAQGLRYLEESLAYTEARDLDSYGLYLRGWRARVRFEQGRWREAEEDALATLRGYGSAAVVAVPALITLAHLYVRQGNPAAGDILDEASAAAKQIGSEQLSGVAAARAEAAWWRGDIEQAVAEARVDYDRARRTGRAWLLGQLAFWLWRAGALTEPPEGSALPYELMLRGEWRAAAAEWERLGCPFEEGLALAQGDGEAQLAALEIFDRLGARPACAALRQSLRAAGVRRIPRGLQQVSRSNSFGLTGREKEVLLLLGEGLSNSDIAARLSISPKTVDHHVSAILAKIGARTRREAVASALMAQQGEHRERVLFPPGQNLESTKKPGV